LGFGHFSIARAKGPINPHHVAITGMSLPGGHGGDNRAGARRTGHRHWMRQRARWPWLPTRDQACRKPAFYQRVVAETLPCPKGCSGWLEYVRTRKEHEKFSVM